MGLINNIALLLVLGLLYDAIVLSRSSSYFTARKFITGFMLGCIGTMVIMNPWVLRPGIIFDTRSILLAMAGLYFGFVPTVIAIIMTSLARIYQGGTGTIVGIAVMLSSGGIGLMWRHLRKPDLIRISIKELYVFGMTVHVVMLALFMFLPWEIMLHVMKTVAPPIIFLYPVGTVLMGKLLSSRLVFRYSTDELLKRDELFSVLTDSALDAIFLKDSEGRFTFVNPAMEELWGTPSHKMLGKTSDQILPPGETLDTINHLNENVRHGGVVNTVHKAFLQGEQKFLHTIMVPLHSADTGTVRGLCGIIRDVTSERTQEARLQHQQKLESLGVLSSGVAHEINNPLNVMMNYGELILHFAAEDEKITGFAHNIVDEGQRISTIVKNLLMFSRQDHESYSSTNLKSVVESTLSLTSSILRKGDIHISIDIPNDLPDITCNYQKIMQVLMNLLTNARDALESPECKSCDNKRIHVGLSIHCSDKNCWQRIVIEDNGPGVPPELRDKIFDPFFTTKPRDKGTGLGLSISHGIVLEHGGHFHMEDNSPRGARFIVDLPVASDECNNMKPESVT